MGIVCVTAAVCYDHHSLQCKSRHYVQQKTYVTVTYRFLQDWPLESWQSI